MSAFKTFLGDTTIPAIVLAGVDLYDVAIPVDEDGWVCRAQLLDSARNALTVERIITDTIMDTNDVLHFIATITLAEADLMSVNDNGQTTKNFWSAEIENSALNYRHTVEVELAVSPKP